LQLRLHLSSNNNIDQEINKYFDMFRETHNEFIVCDHIRKFILNNLSDYEKELFYYRVVKGCSFYDISQEMDITYRIAQSHYSLLSEKIFKGLAKDVDL
jgi:hypothetical protein